MHQSRISCGHPESGHTDQGRTVVHSGAARARTPVAVLTLALVVALAATTFIVPTQAHGISDFWEAVANGTDRREAALAIASRMTNTELIGQILMFGYLNTQPTEEFLSWIEERKLGGVKVFGWNTGNLPEMVEGIGFMQEAATRTRFKIPLLVATDQEGGWVRHVKGGTAVTPGNLAIGAGGIGIDAYNSGYIIGKELSVLGINMNFAPTVDIYTNREAHVIGPRAFSSDPVDTAFLAAGFFRGLEDAGIISTAKHFPGHGNADKDSHGVLPVINNDLSYIWSHDLLPYRVLIKEGIPSIMTGHLSFPKITGEIVPATLSTVFQQDILRDKLGFDGLIITDDMRMHGVLQEGMDIPEACEIAIEAGNDMIMLSRSPEIQDTVWRHLMQIIETDDDFKQRVVESVVRVLTLKMTYLSGSTLEHLSPDPSAVEERLGSDKTHSTFFDIACRSTTVLRNRLIPLDATETGSVAVVGQYSTFAATGLERFEGATTYRFSYYTPSDSEKTDIRRIAESHDVIIYCLANPASLDVLLNLQEFQSKIIVLSVLTPVYLYETPWVESAVAVYATGIDSFRAGFAAICGDFVPEGRAPIPVFSNGD